MKHKYLHTYNIIFASYYSRLLKSHCQFWGFSEYEFATFYFDEKSCKIAMQTYSLILSWNRNVHLIDFCHIIFFFSSSWIYRQLCSFDCFNQLWLVAAIFVEVYLVSIIFFFFAREFESVKTSSGFACLLESRQYK